MEQPAGKATSDTENSEVQQGSLGEMVVQYRTTGEVARHLRRPRRAALIDRSFLTTAFLIRRKLRRGDVRRFPGKRLQEVNDQGNFGETAVV